MRNVSKSRRCSALMRSISDSGEMPSRSARSIVGVPCASLAQTYHTVCPRIRWKRTQTSVCTYSTIWPRCSESFAYGSALVTRIFLAVTRKDSGRDRRLCHWRRVVRAASAERPVERLGETRDGRVDVGELVEAEKSDAERPIVVGLAALKRNAGRDLRSGLREPGDDVGVVRVRDDDTRRLEAFSRDAREAALLEQRADPTAELDLPLAGALEAEIAGLVHH